MTKLNKFFILIIAFVIMLSSAYASSFEVEVVPIADKIVVDEVAEFDIVIKNNLNTEEEFKIRKAGYPFWDMYTKPLQNPITLTVPALGTEVIRLFVDPLYITSVDTYTLEVGVVLERIGEEQKVPVSIGIKSTEPLIGGYIPTVLASMSISPEKIDPRNPFLIKVILNNLNPINYSNLTIKIDSNLIKDELYTPLGPQEEKSVELVKQFDELTAPQADRLVVSIFRDERLIVSPILKEFEIIQYVTQEDIPKEQSFLKIRKGVKVTSNNPDYEGTVKIEITPLKSLLISTNPRAETLKENGKQYLLWRIALDSGSTKTVYVTENYRPLVVIITAIIVTIILYFVFRSPIVVKKGITNVGMSEGGISEAKVFVRVKNRSSNQLGNIEVMDNVPHIAHVEKEISIGSLQPHAVLTHPKKGVLIKWTIEALEPGDERVLSYRMKSRLAILGEFNLPVATARCKLGNKVIISNSNRVSVGG